METSPEGLNPFLARHPTLQYCLLGLLGGFGIYLSMPIVFGPRSTLESIDLAINLVIFVPSALVLAFGGVLAILTGVFSYRLDEEGRVARFARTLLKAFGIPGLRLAELALLGPLGLVSAVLTRRYSGRSISDGSAPGADGGSDA